MTDLISISAAWNWAWIKTESLFFIEKMKTNNKIPNSLMNFFLFVWNKNRFRSFYVNGLQFLLKNVPLSFC